MVVTIELISLHDALEAPTIDLTMEGCIPSVAEEERDYGLFKLLRFDDAKRTAQTNKRVENKEISVCDFMMRTRRDSTKLSLTLRSSRAQR